MLTACLVWLIIRVTPPTQPTILQSLITLLKIAHSLSVTGGCLILYSLGRPALIGLITSNLSLEIKECVNVTGLSPQHKSLNQQLPSRKVELNKRTLKNSSCLCRIMSTVELKQLTWSFAAKNREIHFWKMLLSKWVQKMLHQWVAPTESPPQFTSITGRILTSQSKSSRLMSTLEHGDGQRHVNLIITEEAQRLKNH